jgi:penicillin-binding protein 2
VDSFSKRKNIIISIFLVVGVIFIIRLFFLQVVNSTYKRSATKNVLREVVEFPSRGLIYGRKGEMLVYNQTVYDLMATPREIGRFDTTTLCNVIDIPKEELIAELDKAKKYSSYLPSVVVKLIPPERYALLKEKMFKYPGFYLQTRTIRNYTYNSAAHVLGYIGEVNQSTIDRDPYYKPGDYIGVSGIERAYEKELRGRKGVSLYLVDVHNRLKGEYENGRMDTVAVKGKDLKTTLDIDLQQYGELLMQNKAGSIVAIEPSTGEILAMVTSPSYSPMDMVGRNRIVNFPRLLADTLLPLFNRAVQAHYPPGSTFKMLHGLITLQEGIINPSTSYYCNHGFHVGNFHQACHHEQWFDLNGAITASCNAYFSQAFRDLLESSKFHGVRNGYEAWRNHVLSFGFGDKVSFEFDEESKGFIPTAEYYDKRVFSRDSRWHALSIISLAIGQGEIETTPIQMANYMAILANRGYYYPPHVVREIEDTPVNPIIKEKHYTTVRSEEFEKILDGMEGVVTGGTGVLASVPGIRICGKTGTAQNPHGPDHSTFVAFAPRVNPVIAIAVYVENGKWGNLYAAPIAGLMIEKYINDSIQPSRKWLETRMLETNLLYPDLPNYIKYYK